MVGEFTGAAVAPDQELVAARCRFGEVDDGPVVEPLPLRTGPGRELPPGPAESFRQARFGTCFTRASARKAPALAGTSAEQATATT